MRETFIWLETSWLSVWVREFPSLFGFPFILFLHTLGLAMLAGVSVAIDIWLLRQRELAHPIDMTGLIRVMWLGFGINTVSGLLLLIAYPMKALTNPVFYLKMLLVVLGVVAVARINREVFPGGRAVTGTRIKQSAKRWAVGSLAIWSGTVLTGRLLAYTHHVLLAQHLR